MKHRTAPQRPMPPPESTRAEPDARSAIRLAIRFSAVADGLVERAAWFLVARGIERTLEEQAAMERRSVILLDLAVPLVSHLFGRRTGAERDPSGGARPSTRR